MTHIVKCTATFFIMAVLLGACGKKATLEAPANPRAPQVSTVQGQEPPVEDNRFVLDGLLD